MLVSWIDGRAYSLATQPLASLKCGRVDKVTQWFCPRLDGSNAEIQMRLFDFCDKGNVSVSSLHLHPALPPTVTVVVLGQLCVAAKGIVDGIISASSQRTEI